MSPQLTLVDLLDPRRFAAYNDEAHADLYVAWDALELPVQGIWAIEATRRIAVSEDSGWSDCLAQEQYLRAWMQRYLSPPAREQVTQAVLGTLLTPAWERLQQWKQQHPESPPEDVLVNINGAWIWPDGGRSPTPLRWLQWVSMLEEVQRNPLRYMNDPSNDHVAMIYLLRGLWGGAGGDAAHHVPCFARTPEWHDLLEILRWIYWCAWCADQKGEFGGTPPRFEETDKEEEPCT